MSPTVWRTAITGAEGRRDALVVRLAEARRLLAEADVDAVMGRCLSARMGDQLSAVEAAVTELAICPDEPPWQALAAHERSAAVVLGEVLAVLQRVNAHKAGADHPPCIVADRLLFELEIACDVRWQRLTVPADGDLFLDVAQLIRLRFPADGIWDIPVVAHEFGHFVAQRNSVPDGTGQRRINPAERHIVERTGAAAERATAHLDELYADCFATFAMGPSYPFTALLLRLAPHEAENATHPDATRRFVAMTTVLRCMAGDDREGSFAFERAAELLEAFWRDSLGPAFDRRVAEANANKAAADALAFYRALAKAVAGVRYASWATALRVADRVQQQMDAADTAGPRPATPPSVRDLANAAWQLRLAAEGEAHAISDAAIAVLLTPRGGVR